VAAAESARSAGLLVGSMSSIVVKVQSAGQTLRRLLANRRCQRVRLLFGLAPSSSARSAGRRAKAANHPAGELQAGLAEGLLLGHPVGVAAEVALQVRPAHLALVGVEMAVAVPTVRNDDPGIRGADERVEPLAVAVLGDLQERGARCRGGPQRAALAAGPPAGLIDVHRALIQHPVLQLHVRASERV